MRHFVRLVPSLALGLSLLACSSSTEPTTIAGRLTGTWSETPTVRGSSLIMVLSARDTTVTGTGTYSIEAGRNGTIAVTGVIEDPNILLTVTYDDGDVAHYSATLQGSDSLNGSWWTTSDPIVVNFKRVMP